MSKKADNTATTRFSVIFAAQIQGADAYGIISNATPQPVSLMHPLFPPLGAVP